MFEYIESGLRGVWLKNGFKITRTAYGDATAIQDVEGLHRTIARALIVQGARLSGPEFRFLRKELGLTQAALAGLLGNEEQTVALWERGRQRVPKWADGLLRKLVLETQNGNETLLDLMRRVAEHHDAGAARRVFRESRKGWVAEAA